MNWLLQHRDALLLALRRLVGSPLNTLLSLLAIGVALALPAGGQMLLANAMQASRSLTAKPQISVFAQVGADKRSVQEMGTRLKNIPGVKELRFIPRDEALARMKAGEGLADVIDALPDNPFPDAYVVVPADEQPAAMEQLARELRKLPRVEHVQLDSAWVRRLDALMRLGRNGVLLLALLLGVGLVAITFNAIRSQVLAQRAEIEVGRLLGATDSYIRRPFQYYGTLLGLAGGSLAWLMVAGTTLWLRVPIGELAALYSLDFLLQPLTLIDSAALLGAAAGLGWLGAWLSLGQYLRDI
jgi:cell division transport system permease protein